MSMTKNGVLLRMASAICAANSSMVLSFGDGWGESRHRMPLGRTATFEALRLSHGKKFCLLEPLNTTQQTCGAL